MFTLQSVYLDIEMSVRKTLLESLVEHCRKGSHPLVIGMDSNSHSLAWGSEEDNARGVELEALFIAWNLKILNEGSDHTFMPVRARSRIDVTVINQAARRLQIDGWRVQKDESFSDHKYIEFTCGRYPPSNEQARNYNKMDWGAFSKALKELLEPNGGTQNDAVGCTSHVSRRGRPQASSSRLQSGTADNLGHFGSQSSAGSRTVEPRTIEPRTIEPRTIELRTIEPPLLNQRTIEPWTIEPIL
jgi:hypothetical protein